MKIVVRSWKFNNLAIEPSKILARIRQDLGSKYTRDLIVTIMQDINGKHFKILQVFLLVIKKFFTDFLTCVQITSVE